MIEEIKLTLLGLILAGFSLNSSAMKSNPVIPIAIKDQISLADGVIIGTFQGSSNTKNKDGRVTTIGNFYVEQVAGIPARKILNRYSFRVEYPGGYWQGIKYKSKEAPQFALGEKVALILKKGKFGYELPYQALSKFNFENKNGELHLYSRYFTGRKGVGSISWSEFNQVVEQQFGMRVGSYFNKRNNLNHHKGAHIAKNRGPASYYNTVEKEPDYKIETYWLVLILGALGGMYSFFGKYREEYEANEDH